MAQLHDRTVRCVGAVIFDHRGRLLLVRRVNEPGKGRWSLPGGRIEAGETAHRAVFREVAEETGLNVEVTAHLGNVQRPASDGVVFDIQDYRCRVLGGTLRAGDDADAARWCDAATLELLPTVDGLIEVLTEWDSLPSAAPQGSGCGRPGCSPPRSCP